MDPISSLADTPEPTSQDVDYLNTLVGDGKKYQSPAELAKAYYHADIAIRNLTEKLDRTALTEGKLNEVLEAIKTKPQTSPTPDHNAAVEAPGPIDIENVVQQALTKEQQRLKAEANNEVSKSRLLEHYGSPQAVSRAVQEVINDNPATKRFVDELAMSDPAKFIDFITKLSPKRGDEINTPGAGQHSGGTVASVGLTWSEAQRTRRENPSLYHTTAFRKRMTDALAKAESLGIDYYKT